MFVHSFTFFLYSFTDPHGPHGDDFDWEDESELSDSQSEDDFVPVNDSDENLAEYATPPVSTLPGGRGGTIHGA